MINPDGVYGQLGSDLGAFYLVDAYQPGRKNGVTDAFAKVTIDSLQSKLPSNAEVVMKAYRGDGPQ